jgi:nucleoside-diphosphate-sugar epimerase
MPKIKKASKDKKIIVTGGAGFIGSVLVPKLVDLEYKVIILDRLYFGQKSFSNLKGKVKFINADVVHPPKAIFKNIDYVIHLAGLSNDPMSDYNPTANRIINTEATARLASLAKSMGVKKFIFSSSCSVYDLEGTDETMIKNERSKVKPVRYYPLSKYNAEKALVALANKNFEVTILRLGTVMGVSPRMRFDLVVNTMVKTALKTGIIEVYSKGKQWRPLIEVNDVADAFISVLKSDADLNKQIFNIALGNYQIKRVAEIVKDTLLKNYNHKIKIIDKESSKPDRTYRVSIRKAKKLLKFSPQNPISKTVLSISEFVKKNRLNTDDPIYYNIEWMKNHISFTYK